MTKCRAVLATEPSFRLFVFWPYEVATALRFLMIDAIGKFFSDIAVGLA